MGHCAAVTTTELALLCPASSLLIKDEKLLEQHIRLPDNVLLQIFAQLSFRERVRVAHLVCWQWLRVLRAPSPLWNSICYCVTNLNPHVCGGISTAEQAASFAAWVRHRAAGVRALACCSCLRVDEATAAQVAVALQRMGPALACFEFDCYSSSYGADGLPIVFGALRHCGRLQQLSLKGEHCLRALEKATCLAGGWRELTTLSLSFKGGLPALVCGWGTLRRLSLTLAHPETLKWRPDDEVLSLRLPPELSRLQRLHSLAITFADARPGEHPGEGNRLLAGSGLPCLGRLQSLRLSNCSLCGEHWPAAWAGLTGLTELAFVDCLGASVGDALQAVCAAGPPLARLEVSDAHAVTKDASLVKGCPQLSALRGLRELVCNNQRRSPHVACLEHLTSLQVRNSVDMYPDADTPPGSFPPLVARLLCEQWLSLSRLVALDFSRSDDLTLCDMRWSTLASLRELFISDIKRLVVVGGDDLADLAALPDLAIVDARRTVPGDAHTTVQLFDLAFLLRGAGRFLM